MLLCWRHQHLRNGQRFHFCWCFFENEYACILVVYLSGAKSHCCLKNKNKQKQKNLPNPVYIFLIKHTRKGKMFHALVIEGGSGGWFMLSVMDFLQTGFYSIRFLLDSQNQAVMRVGLFVEYNVCQVSPLFSEVVPNLKMGFYKLAVFMALLLLNLNI